MENATTIHDLPRRERPRERLFGEGPGALSGVELLAVLLGTGTGGTGVLELASALLARTGGLGGLVRMDPRELTELPGIGPAKAATLAAAFELGRRAAEAELPDRTPLDRPEVVGPFLATRLRGRETEVFGCIALDGRHRLLTVRELTAGTRRHAPVDPAELFRQALLDGASSVLVFHNHPSGVTEPSADDLALTRRLAGAGAAIGVPVLDHLIVAGPAWVSLRVREPGLFAAPAAPGRW